jgi:hypothetical protein
MYSFKSFLIGNKPKGGVKNVNNSMEIGLKGLQQSKE